MLIVISDFFGFEWLICGIFYKLVWVLMKNCWICFCDKRGKLDSGFFILCVNIGNYLFNIIGEFLGWCKLIVYKGLIVVI